MNRTQPLTGPDLEDRGLYLQGLVQLMAADRHLDAVERERIRAYAIAQGFAERFIEDVMDSVLENAHFPRTPARFHHADTAVNFLRDATRLALCDGILHPREERWLMEAARRNDIDPTIVTAVLADEDAPQTGSSNAAHRLDSSEVSS
jgi:hypothetical protein